MTLKKSVLWNAVGSIYYLGIQWLTTVLVVRLSGSYLDAGIYSLASSVTNIFYAIAMYSVRNYQVSDYSNEFENYDYVVHRISTMLLAVVLCGLFAVGMYSDKRIVLVIMCYMVFKTCESFVDVLHGIDQKNDRMDIIGKSYLLRGTVQIVVFCITLIMTGDIAWTIFSMVVSTVVLILLYDVRQSRRLREDVFRLNLVRAEKIRCIYIKCLPLLLYGLAMTAVASIPRIMLEKMHGDRVLGYYASVAAPAIVVQTLANVVFVPFVNVFTEYYNRGDSRAFYRLMRRMLLFCLGLGVSAWIAARLGAEFVLADIIYEDARIVPYCYLLSSTIVCSALVAVIWFFAMLLVIDRARETLIYASVIGVIMECVIGYRLIREYGMDGINVSLIISYAVIIGIMFVSCLIRFHRHFAKSDEFKRICV